MEEVGNPIIGLVIIVSFRSIVVSCGSQPSLPSLALLSEEGEKSSIKDEPIGISSSILSEYRGPD